MIKARFFDGIIKLDDQSKLPTPPVAIEPDNYQHLGSYHIVPDGYGLNDKLTINEVHLSQENGKWVWDWGGEQGLLEMIVHEVCHEYIQRKSPEAFDPKKKNATHPPGMIKKLQDLGINCNAGGVHERPCDDPNSPLGILMREWGIPFENLPGTEKRNWYKPENTRGRGKSTIHKGHCPGCGEIRYSTKKHPKIIICGECLLPYIDDTAPAMLGMVEPKKSGLPDENSSPAQDKPLETEGGSCRSLPDNKKKATEAQVGPEFLAPATPTDKVLKPGEEFYVDDEIKRRQMEEGYRQCDDPEDLSTYLEPYQNDYGDLHP